MTHPHDPPRQWSRPVEEVARAMCNRRMPKVLLSSADAWDNLNAWTNNIGEPDLIMERDAFLADAEAALTRLISLGFINENGIEAMKAEKEAK